MPSTLVLFITAILCLEAPPTVRGVPEPNFEKPVDYAAWARTVIQRDAKDTDDASGDYDAIIRSIEKPADKNWIKAFGFKGPTTDYELGISERIELWSPEKHAEWEAAHQRTRAAREAFYAAASKPYWALSLTRGHTAAEDCEPTLLDIDPLISQPEMVLARGAIDAAWRSDDGKLNIEDFMKMVRANLGLARQLERDPFVSPGQQTLGLRALTYYSVLSTLRMGVLDPAGRERLRDELAKADAPLPSFEVLLAAELAAINDALQSAANKESKLPCAPRAKALAQSARAGKVDAAKIARAAAKFFDDCSKRSSRPYDPGCAPEIEQMRQEIKKSDSELFRLISTTAKYHNYIVRMEAQRRAVRCLTEMHVYRDQNGRWPKALTDLPSEIVKQFATDPFSGKPFGYVLAADGAAFTLYSVAQDGVDNGGKHDPRWSDVKLGNDYVFWSGAAQDEKVATQPAPAK
ncbi:MAG: hypothetical protein JNG88_06475 [Phycisphaerales bacterium]|nr:hypothetical protein [Phycisphaerales bacterium]